MQILIWFNRNLKGLIWYDALIHDKNIESDKNYHKYSESYIIWYDFDKTVIWLSQPKAVLKFGSNRLKKLDWTSIDGKHRETQGSTNSGFFWDLTNSDPWSKSYPNLKTIPVASMDHSPWRCWEFPIAIATFLGTRLRVPRWSKPLNHSQVLNTSASIAVWLNNSWPKKDQTKSIMS